jgi:hypothetical protein
MKKNTFKIFLGYVYWNSTDEKWYSIEFLFEN